jgi:hypothetical protein
MRAMLTAVTLLNWISRRFRGSMRGDEYLHASGRKAAEDCHLGCCPHFQAQEYIEWQSEHQDIRQDRETRDCDVELGLDAFRIRVIGGLPYRLYRKTLKDNDKENSNGLQRSESNDAVHGYADTLSLFSNTQYEDKDRAFDQGENGVVEDLRNVEPP